MKALLVEVKDHAVLIVEGHRNMTVKWYYALVDENRPIAIIDLVPTLSKYPR